MLLSAAGGLAEPASAASSSSCWLSLRAASAFLCLRLAALRAWVDFVLVLGGDVDDESAVNGRESVGVRS